jgi:hypothetical protein
MEVGKTPLYYNRYRILARRVEKLLDGHLMELTDGDKLPWEY